MDPKEQGGCETVAGCAGLHTHTHTHTHPQVTSSHGMTNKLLIPSQILESMGQPSPNLVLNPFSSKVVCRRRRSSCLNCLLQGRVNIVFLVSFAFLHWAHKSFRHDLQKILPSSLDSSKLVNTHVHFCINDESL